MSVTLIPQSDPLLTRATRWATTEPARFRVGQIVQLEVSFRVVPSNGRTMYRMVPLLRSIALLDSELYMVSA